MVGLSQNTACEFNSSNMRNFNEVAEDKEGVNYYSFGSKRPEMHINEILRPGYAIITGHKIQYECDGMVETNECRWGQYLVTFDHDHFEVVGFNPRVKPQHVANLVIDNLRFCEVQQNSKGAYRSKKQAKSTKKGMKKKASASS